MLEKIEYDSGQLESLHGDIGKLIDQGNNAQIVLHNVEDGLEGRGESISLVKTESGSLANQMKPTISTLERVAKVVQAYGEAVAQHAKAANDLIDDIEAAQATLDSAATDFSTAQTNERMCTADDNREARSTSEQDLTDAQSALTTARNALEDLWEEWESAYSLWDEAYDAAVVSIVRFNGTPLTVVDMAAFDDLAGADTPEEVAEIWNKLTDAQKDKLRDTYPEFIGNLEGVPYFDRFIANKMSYEKVVKNGPYGDPIDSQLEAMYNELNDGGGQLLEFHPFESPQATAAIMYGLPLADPEKKRFDPFDGVTNVNVLVGGMNSGLGDVPEWGQSARDLNAFADAYGDGTKSATIAWFGYDSPNEAQEPLMDKATEGAAALTETLRGLDNEVSMSVTTSVIAHSYGSTTAFLAVGESDDNLGVDNLIAFGSAGVPDSDYENWTGNDPMDYSGTDIFATRAPGDIWAPFGIETAIGHSTNPADIPGAVTFESDGGDVPSIDGGTEYGVGTPGHGAHDGGNGVWGWWEEDNGYLSRDSEAFRNIAHIVGTGEPLS
ncbi:MAG: alpha/beta hydrolase [Rhodoglobus sp.]